MSVMTLVTPVAKTYEKPALHKNLQVQQIVSSTDRSLTHGPSCTTVDGSETPKNFSLEKLVKSWTTDGLTVRRSNDGP